MPAEDNNLTTRGRGVDYKPNQNLAASLPLGNKALKAWAQARAEVGQYS